MAELLVDFKFATPIKKVIVGPCPDRPGAVKLGNNQSITQDEAEAFERMYQAGFEIEFALVKEASIGTWENVPSGWIVSEFQPCPKIGLFAGIPFAYSLIEFSISS